MTDLETWVHDNTDTFYRISRYKRLYTPYEQDKKYSDESVYEETYQGKITGVVDTGNDKLLEIEGEEDNVIKDGKVKLDDWLEFTEPFGMKCE